MLKIYFGSVNIFQSFETCRKMFSKLSISALNINGLKHYTLGDKLSNNDFIDNIKDHDLIFLTETCSNKINSIPGFKAIFSLTATPKSDSKPNYIICGRELTQTIENFFVKPPSYLSDHSQLVTWIKRASIHVSLSETTHTQQPKTHKLPQHFI